MSSYKDLGRIGANWTTIDKFDPNPQIDCAYDLLDMPFADGAFKEAFCQSVLEHVINPQKGIAEMRRVLSPGGLIFVQLPFSLNYHADPDDYWRVSPQGLRLWMDGFDEIRCGGYSYTGSPFTVTSYLVGRKLA